MPAHLIQAMPMLVLGLAALAWIFVRSLVLRRVGGEAGPAARRDLWVGLAVAGSWFAVWAVYSAYSWTADYPAMTTLQVVRFYVPAIGAISLLGAWLVTRIPGPAWLAGVTSAAVVTAMFGLGVWSFHAMLAPGQAANGQGPPGSAVLPLEQRQADVQGIGQPNQDPPGAGPAQSSRRASARDWVPRFP